MDAASLPRAPPAVIAPSHTQHTGDDGLVELLPWSWSGGSHGATTLTSRVVLGQRARFWSKMHITLVEG